jgi:hypothetical protein
MADPPEFFRMTAGTEAKERGSKKFLKGSPTEPSEFIISVT